MQSPLPRRKAGPCRLALLLLCVVAVAWWWQPLGDSVGLALASVRGSPWPLRAPARPLAPGSEALVALRGGKMAMGATEGNFKVCVCGGAGGIGQPLSMLMAMNPNVAEVAVQDITMAAVPPAGVAADIGHLESKARVTGYAIDPKQPAKDQLEECLSGCDLVLIPAGVPRKPGMTRDDLFQVNADIAKGLAEACATHCPNAVVALIVNPVNSIVPAVGELYKKKGLDSRKVLGITTLDTVRANKFVAEACDCNPDEVDIPVVGGHAGATILPLFSQDPKTAKLAQDVIEALDKRTQVGGTEVVDAKAGAGSATLSMAYAGARLGQAVLNGLMGKTGKEAEEHAYVATEGVSSELPYFSSKVTFGKSGVEKVHPVGKLSDYEATRLKEVNEQLEGEIAKGLEYAAQNELA
jgi:malate dehydrogenase